MTNTIAVPGTEIKYTEGEEKLWLAICRKGTDIEMQLMSGRDETEARTRVKRGYIVLGINSLAMAIHRLTIGKDVDSKEYVQ